MSNLEQVLCRNLLKQAGSILPHKPHVAVILQLTATAIELGTTQELAEAVLGHETRQLRKFKKDIDHTLSSLRRNPSDN